MTVIQYIKKRKLPGAFLISHHLGYRIPLADVKKMEQQLKQEKLNIKQDYLTSRQAANRLNISKCTLGNYIRDNRFPNAQIKKQNVGYLIPLTDIERFEEMMGVPEGFMNVKEIAETLNCHQESVRQLIRNGEFKGVKWHSGNGHGYLVWAEEVKRFYNRKIYQVKDYVNITQAAEFLSCHKDTIRKYIKKGVLNNYLYRDKCEGYLIYKEDLLKTQAPLNIPDGFMDPEEAAKRLKVSKGQVLSLARSKFKSSYKIKKGNGMKTWIISEEDVSMYKKVKDQKFTPENADEYTTLDAVNKFEFEAGDLFFQIPRFMVETYELYSNYAKSKLSNSNARAETLKKKVAYYIKTMEIILQMLDKNIYNLTDEEIEDILKNPEIVGYVKQYFIGFTRFCLECVKGCNFKNEYKTVNRENLTETKVYSVKTFKEYYVHVKYVDLHLGHAIKRKTYAQTWLYVIMHLMNAWRSGDIVYGTPKIDLDGLNINDFTYFRDHRLTREQAQLIVNQVHQKVGKIKFSKTGALGQFLCIDSLAIPFATVILIVELHRRKRNGKLMLDSIRSNGVNKKFFENNESLADFDSLKMNRTLITYFFHYTSKSGGDAHLSYEASQILRSHVNEDTTMVYIKFSNAEGSLDEISFNICERGHFGWVFNCMINLFLDQKCQTIQERTKMIQDFQRSYTVPEIETYASFLLTERNQKESIALRLAKMPKHELKDVIIKIFRGEMPAKTEMGQCLLHPNCLYPTRKTCIGCEYLI